MWGSHAQMGLAHLYVGDAVTGLRELKLAAEKQPNSTNVTYYAHALGKTGKTAEAGYLLKRFLNSQKGHYVCAYEIGCAYDSMKKREEALRWFQKGVDQRCDCLLWGGVEPWMEDLKKDMRYKAIQALVQ
jgi:hypothetical protein